jgi:hypothetical protein
MGEKPVPKAVYPMDRIVAGWQSVELWRIFSFISVCNGDVNRGRVKSEKKRGSRQL